MDLSPRLSSLLARALQFRFTEIVAPAGFGKSTVIDALARDKSVLVARIREDTDASFTLMRALCSAATSLVPDLEKLLPTAYSNATSSGSLQDLAPWFLRALPPEDLTIAVDDLHLLSTDGPAWNLLRSIADAADRVRWVFASRTWPLLPSVDWVARGDQGKSIREADLAFDDDDVKHAADIVGVTIKSDVSSQIQRLTKGWPLLCLYALRLLAHENGTLAIADVIKGRGLEDITRRLLGQLSVASIEVLSALAVYDGALPEEIELTHPGASEEIERFILIGLPITQGGDRRWRVHDILREYLFNRYIKPRPETVQSLARRLEAVGFAELALKTAIIGGDLGFLASILERHSNECLESFDRQLVRRALNMFPNDRVESNATLARLRGVDETVRGKFELAVPLLRRAVATSDASERASSLIRLSQALLMWDGHAAEAVNIARQAAAAALPPNPREACDILSFVAFTLAVDGDHEGSAQVIEEAAGFLRQTSDPAIEAHFLLRASRVATHAGDFVKAKGLAHQALAVAETHSQYQALRGIFEVLRITSAAESDAESKYWTQRWAEHSTKMLDAAALYLCDLTLLNFACREGDIDTACALRRRLYAERTNSRERTDCVLFMLDAHLAMLEGDYEAARDAIARISTFGEQGMMTAIQSREVMVGAYRATLLQLSNACRAAISEARRVIALAANVDLRTEGLCARPELEFSRMLCAAVLASNGLTVDAHSILREISVSASEGYRRDIASWAAVALSNASVAPSARAQTYGGGFVELIRRLNATEPQKCLTQTERRVLESLAEGYSSKQIASLTGRSVKTVNNQVSAILRKLNARSRGEAVARARRTGLLGQEREPSYAILNRSGENLIAKV